MGLRIHLRTLSGRQCTPLISPRRGRADFDDATCYLLPHCCLANQQPQVSRDGRRGQGRAGQGTNLGDRCAGSQPPAQPHTASAQTTTLAVRHFPPVPVAGFNVVIVREGDAGEQQIALPMLLRNLRLRLMGLGIFT